MKKVTGIALVAWLGSFGTPALAAGDEPRGGPDDRRDDIVVTGVAIDRTIGDIVTQVDVLTGDELVHRRQSTLGETLNGLPGINSDTFGGGASRPIIRGQTAPRVKVLSDGSEILDASGVSPDHAITAEPLLLDTIEVLRGPAALLYGGGAINGAVNLIDQKIPTRLPRHGAEGAAELRAGTADRERSAVGGITAGMGSFAIRLEGAMRNTDDYEAPDYRRDPGDPTTPRVPDSYNDTSTATIGASWVRPNGYLGLAYTEQRSDYGIPGHTHEYENCHTHGAELHCGTVHGQPGIDEEESHDHGEAEGAHDAHHPRVDLLSRRVDVRGEIRNPFSFIERIRIRGGYTDYRHDELEADVAVTRFTNKGYDGRIEVQHAPVAGIQGVIGGQHARSDFAATGKEAFVPESRTETSAIFLLEEYVHDDWRLKGAVRQEWQRFTSMNLNTYLPIDRTDRPFSLSGGVEWTALPGYIVSLNVGRAQRAPNVQELAANGRHLATNAFEYGEETLGKETSASVDLGLRGDRGATSFAVNGYHYDYNDYVYARTVDRVRDFRLIRYAQADARFTGVEGQVTHRFIPGFSLTAFGDYVRGRLRHGLGDLPRIPAGRLGIRANGKAEGWQGSAEYIRVFDQHRVEALERTTPGYNMVNATLSYDLTPLRVPGQIFVRGTNLLDQPAFNHASFVSRLAPLRGRNLLLGVRAQF